MDSAAKQASLIGRGLFAVLFPSDCRLCNTPLRNVSRLPVCEECLAAIRPISIETCAICGDALPGLARPEQQQLCGNCQESRQHFAKAVAYGAYDKELRELIHLLKYEQVEPAASVLGKMLADAIAKLRLDSPVLIVPVPLHASKRRQRGFNQSELIARATLKKLRWQHTVFTNALVRVKVTTPQIGLTPPQRRENIRGAFQVVHPNRVKGRSILLVDDVLTTGTTASECARVLLKAGADKVLVATVARTLKIVDSGFVTDHEFAAQAS